jgi:hypothetical protein
MNIKYLFDGTLGEFNMDTLPISLQLMDPNCKPIHARAYTVPRSVEQQSKKSKEIARLVDIGVFEEDYSSEWASICPSFAIPKKIGTKRVVTDFRKLSYCWNVTHFLFQRLNTGMMLMLKIYVPLYSHGKWENKKNAYPWVSRLPQMFSKLHV